MIDPALLADGPPLEQTALDAVARVLAAEADANKNLRLAGEAPATAAMALILLVRFRDGIGNTENQRAALSVREIAKN